jgi:hypothetical protein
MVTLSFGDIGDFIVVDRCAVAEMYHILLASLHFEFTSIA